MLTIVQALGREGYIPTFSNKFQRGGGRAKVFLSTVRCGSGQFLADTTVISAVDVGHQ